MLLTRSPSLLFAFIFSISSIILTIWTFQIGSNHPEQHIQFLIILPPLNCIFAFLFSLIWTERRFRLSYIPLLCLLFLFFSSLTITITSAFFLSLSFVLYINFIFYVSFTLLFALAIIILIISYLYGSEFVQRRRNRITIEQQNDQFCKTDQLFPIDRILLESKDNQLTLFMSKLPGRRIRDDIRNIVDDLNQIHVDMILTLNEAKEFTNLSNIDVYSMHIKRVNIEHIIYPIRSHFLPKSISDYMQFLYGLIISMTRSHRHRLLVHCMSGMGRTGMTVVCFELLYDYVRNDNDGEHEQTFLERFCHYPILLAKSCRVCRAISKVRKARPGSLSNPLQILFAHEFYARLKSPSYMQQIRNIFDLQEKHLLKNFEDIRLPIDL